MTADSEIFPINVWNSYKNQLVFSPNADSSIKYLTYILEQKKYSISISVLLPLHFEAAAVLFENKIKRLKRIFCTQKQDFVEGGTRNEIRCQEVVNLNEKRIPCNDYLGSCCCCM